jgi:hypothetical protein
MAQLLDRLLGLHYLRQERFRAVRGVPVANGFRDLAS